MWRKFNRGYVDEDVLNLAVFFGGVQYHLVNIWPVSYMQKTVS